MSFGTALGIYRDLMWGAVAPVPSAVGAAGGKMRSAARRGAAALRRGSTLLRSDRTYGNFSC